MLEIVQNGPFVIRENGMLFPVWALLVCIVNFFKVYSFPPGVVIFGDFVH